ncbi:uncharacterized protein LOC114579445 [Dendrobium catenatum]|uniref:uncharacterized protein LOC114579445 n=1 Tax=Dendrobium catenatum TaxID=906689 RepID=UPI0010A0065C|nr:uncharacterized protein LOC114579445 [Dendrobium catenatum]
MELKFARVDGRGKADTDWMVYHLPYIGLWEDRRAYIIEGITAGPDSGHFIHEYLQWFRSWATLYMLKPPTTPPTTYYPRAPSERYLRNFFVETERAVLPLVGSNDYSNADSVIKRIAEMAVDLRREVHIPDYLYSEHGYTGSPYESFSPVIGEPQSTDAGPSSYQDLGPSQPFFTQPTQQTTPGWYPHEHVPDSTLAGTVEAEQEGIFGVEQHVRQGEEFLGDTIIWV